MDEPARKALTRRREAEGWEPEPVDEETREILWFMQAFKGDVPLVEVAALVLLFDIFPRVFGTPLKLIRRLMHIREWTIQHWPRPSLKAPKKGEKDKKDDEVKGGRNRKYGRASRKSRP